VKRPLEGALAAAEAARAPQLMMNTLGNMAIKRIDEGELEEATELMQKAADVAKSYGNRWGVAWTGVWSIELAYLEGRWDDAIREVEGYLHPDSGWERFGGIVMNSQSLAARLHLGRGELDAALDRTERFLAHVRAAIENRLLPEGLALRARVLLAVGRDDEAGTLFEQCARDIEERGSSATGSPPWNLLDFTAVGVRLGRLDELRRVLAGSPTHARWVDGCRAMADEDYERAAELYSRLGAGSEEALARLCGAECLITEGKRTEGALQLEQALAFFRKAGAALYIEQAEKLLATSV
jgi:tetratricopeptide (TPR) repeat protein